MADPVGAAVIRAIRSPTRGAAPCAVSPVTSPTSDAGSNPHTANCRIEEAAAVWDQLEAGAVVEAGTHTTEVKETVTRGGRPVRLVLHQKSGEE
jgi:hypothetical protein